MYISRGAARSPPTVPCPRPKARGPKLEARLKAWCAASTTSSSYESNNCFDLHASSHLQAGESDFVKHSACMQEIRPLYDHAFQNVKNIIDY